MKLPFVSALIALGILVPPAQAQGPRTAYQATYESYAPTGQATLATMYSDGRGHMRNETVANGQKMVSILDFPGKCMYSINDQMKTIMKMPLEDNTLGNSADDAWAKKMNAQKLGVRTVEGHPCTGWNYRTGDGHTTQLWHGNDTDCTVLLVTDGKTSQKLKSYSRTNPPASFFTPPAGYKMQDMTAMMQQMQQMNKMYQGGQGGQSGMPDYSKMDFSKFQQPGSSSQSMLED